MSFLYDYQMDAVNKMKNGCILNGGVGSGKSRTGLYYYFKEQGGSFIDHNYVKMKNPRDLYIITTAMKRDKHEWESEIANYRMSTDGKNTPYKHKVVIDSWNNIQKYKNVAGAFFIFDEDRLTGKGVWVKTFYNIARKNKWIILLPLLEILGSNTSLSSKQMGSSRLRRISYINMSCIRLIVSSQRSTGISIPSNCNGIVIAC